MQTVSTNLSSVLNAGRTTPRDLISVYEFYAPTITPGAGGFDPTTASKRFAPITLTWNGLAYQRQVVKRGAVSRFMGKSFNSCTVTFSNVDRSLAAWINTVDIEGYRLVIRIVSPTYNTLADSLVIFVGRVDKPADFDRVQAVISATQDLGSIDYEMPPYKFQVKCPLKFKGIECTGNIAAGSHSAAWQAATTCDKSFDQCTQYTNTNFFRGIRMLALHGGFTYQTTETRSFLLFFHKKKKVNHTEQWSSVDGTPYGQPIPFVLGRCQMEGIPISFADIGQFLIGLYAWCEGKISGYDNTSIRTAGYGTFNTVGPRVGDWGGFGTNDHEDPQFVGSGMMSRLAFQAFSINGSRADVVDDAPTITATVRGMLVDLPDVTTGVFNQTGWTDNPAYLTRFILTEPRLVRLNSAFIDDVVCFDTGNWCDAPLKDVSNTERVFIPTGDIPAAGTLFKRYRSTGLIDSRRPRYYDLFLDATPYEQLNAQYESFDPQSLPTSFSVATQYRKRYTANVPITDTTKAVDFLFNTLLPSFRGYFVIGANGKIQIKTERPADNSTLRVASLAAATTIELKDVTPWRTSLAQRVLIGNGLTTSEVRDPSAAVYNSTVQNACTIAVSKTGTITLSLPNGGLFISGSSSTQAVGQIVVGGTPASGNTATATVNGTPVTYTLDQYDTTSTVAYMLAVAINADPVLRLSFEARWASASPTVVNVFAKQGTLTIPALTNAHSINEEVLRIAFSFADGETAATLAQSGLTSSNMLPNSIKWPQGGKQSSINQVVLKFRDSRNDFALTPLEVNDYDHQDQIGKVNKLEIDGSAIDNVHQAERIANAALSKNREGNWFASWGTGPMALALEEGDVVCVTDDSGGLINQVVRIEDLKINENHTVSITGRRYSTTMFSDTASQHTIPLPTTLRYTQPANTRLILMDAPVIRDGDAAKGPGILAAITKSGLGDWRGCNVYARLDGVNNTNMGLIDTPAKIGTSTTQLGNVTNSSVWDRANTLDVVLDYGATLSSSTEYDVTNGANLAWHGGEIIQFVTATLIDAPTNKWRLSTLLRGLYGTEDKVGTHGATDTFVLIDGSVKYIPLDSNMKDKAVIWTAVTIGQDVIAGTQQTFTWTARSLLCLAPVNIKGTVNASNDWLVDWTPRSREAPGLRPGTGVPTAEEITAFVVEVLNGSAIVRTANLVDGAPQSVVWLTTFGPGAGLYSSDSAFSVGPYPLGLDVANVGQVSVQKLKGNFALEWTVRNATNTPTRIGLAYAEAASATNFTDLQNQAPFYFSRSPGATVTVEGFAAQSVVSGDRMMVRCSNGLVEYFKNYSGPLSVPFYTSTVAHDPAREYIAFGFAGATTSITFGADSVRVIKDASSWLYTAAQQTADFGSTQSSLHVRIYQVSAVVGRGIPADVTITQLPVSGGVGTLTASFGLRSGLVSHWTLDEASGTRFDSVGTNHLTDNNTVTMASGVVGTSAQFVSANAEMLSCVSNSTLQAGNIDFTFATWVELDIKDAIQVILFKGAAIGTAEYTLWYGSGTDRFNFRVTDGVSTLANAAANSFGAPALSTWYFITAWYDKTAKTVNIQINNGAINSVAVSFTPTVSANEFRIGNDTGNFFDGRVDNLSFWKRVLSPEERTALYNGGAGLGISSY